MIERASKFRIFERRKIETGPDQRVWRPSVDETITSGHDAVVISFISIVAKRRIEEEEGTKIISLTQPYQQFECILFFFKERRK